MCVLSESSCAIKVPSGVCGRGTRQNGRTPPPVPCARVQCLSRPTFPVHET